MNKFPDLNSYGYEILEPIGNNYQGGRITWKAKKLDNNQTVVVKQFRFATANSTWSGYKAYQQEISILQSLNHPRIPQYIESFETQDGFSLIQQYIQGENLEQKNNLTISQIKLIAQKILKILVYLQKQNPPILHQNITPKNIILDQLGNVYLVDFGLATRLDVSSDNNSLVLTAGTPGFIAPKQNIAPTRSSDLYSLGVTIICLLTKKKSSEIVELIAPDQPYQIQFQSLISNVDRDFINWIEKMIHPQITERFTNAKSALKALQEIDWDLADLSIITQEKSLAENTALSPQKYTLSILGIGTLGMVTTIGFQIIDRVTDKTLINIIIAAIAMVIIYIAQYGAATAFKTDPEGKAEALTLAIATPITLTLAAGFIFGRGEAVAISFAATIAQMAIFTTVLWQKLAENQEQIKIIGLLSAIILGMIMGLKINI